MGPSLDGLIHGGLNLNLNFNIERVAEDDTTHSIRPFELITTQPWHAFTFGLGSGLIPYAPGTFGTLIAIPFYLILQFALFNYYWLIVLVLTLLGFALCHTAGRQLGEHDHPAIVWDEIVGYLWAMVFIPLSWVWLVIGFVLFRGFDALKPWPVSWVDRSMKHGIGVMLDDILAALYTWLILQALRFFMS